MRAMCPNVFNVFNKFCKSKKPLKEMISKCKYEIIEGNMGNH